MRRFAYGLMVCFGLLAGGELVDAVLDVGQDLTGTAKASVANYDDGEYRFLRTFETMSGRLRHVLDEAYEQIRAASSPESQTSPA